ncbi:MAG: extracellular solute-binding protein [Thermomicrobiales bacterium]
MDSKRADAIVKKFADRQISRRGLVKGAAVAGAVAAVGAPSATFFAPTVLGQDKGKVTFWTTHSDTGLEALQQIGSDFNAQSDKWEVEVVKRPDADVTDSSSLITAVRAGEGPDTYLLDRFIVAERAANGLLEDLTQMMTDAGLNPDLSEKWVDFAAAEATWDNAPYALPFDTDVRALFYNEDLLKASGVDYSAFDKANGPTTYDKMGEIFQAVNKDEGGNFSQMGYVPYFGQAGSLYTDGFAFGGSFFDYEACQVTPDNEKVVAAANWGKNYIETIGGYEKVNKFVAAALKTGAAPTDSPFTQGRLAGMNNGNWMFANFRKYQPDTKISYTFTPTPNAGDPSYTWAGGWSGVIPKGAKNPEGGFAFLQFLTGNVGMPTYVKMNNNLPVLRELLADKSLFDEDLTWFVDNLFPGTKNRPPLPVGAKYWDELKSAWEAIYLGQSSAEDALAQCKENVQQEIDAGGYCPIAAPKVSEPASPEATPAG